MSDKIDELLPVFLALSSSFEVTKRLILMKYMFEDQVKLIPNNIYIISLENLQKIRDQFTGYFNWVRSVATNPQHQQQQQQAQQQQQHPQQAAMSMPGQQPHMISTSGGPVQGMMSTPQSQAAQLGLGVTPMQQQQPSQQQQPFTQSPAPPSAALQNQTPQQQQMQRQQAQQARMPPQQQPQQQNRAQATPQQQNQELPQGSAAAAAAAATASPAAMGMKRGSIDLKLPPSKKRATAQKPSPTLSRQGQQTPPQQQQQPHAGKMDTGSPADQGKPPGQASNASTPEILGSTPMVNAGVPNGAILKAQKTALARGIPEEIVALLPPKALHCTVILQQAEQKEINLTSAQLSQIEALLNERIAAAKKQLEQQRSQQQQQQQAQKQQPPSQQPPQPQQQPQQQAPVVDLSGGTPPQQQPPSASLPRSSPAVAHTPASFQQAATPPMARPASVASPASDVAHTPQQLQQQQHQQQNAFQRSVPSSTLSHATISTPVASAIAATAATMGPTPTTAATTPASLAASASVQPSMTTLRPGMGPDDKVVNPMAFTNDILKDIASLMNVVPTEDENSTVQMRVVPDGTMAMAYEPMMPYASALKEGYKDETFSTALEATPIEEPTTTDEEDVIGSAWYELGMDQEVLGIGHIMSGFEFDENNCIKT